MKAKIALLEASPPTCQSSKPFQSKNKGLVAKMFDWDEEEVSDNKEETRVQVLMALADEELFLTELSSKNDAKDNPFVPASLDYDHEMVPKSKDWVERLNPDSKLPNFNTGRILVPESEAVNECLQLTKASSNPKSSKESGSKFQTPLPPLKNLQGASPSAEVMTLTYTYHSPRERSGLGTMKYTKPETQESLNKNVSGPVTVSNPESVTSSVHTEVKTNDQESKINELTKPVQMLMDEKINSTQKHQEPIFVSSHPESSTSVNSSKQSQDSKSNGKNPDSSKRVRLKPLQKPKLKCELCNYINHSNDDCYRIFYYMKCKREDHKTSDHEINYLECEICGSYNHFTLEHNRVIQIRGGVLAESSHSSESSIGVSCTTCGSNVHSATDHNDFEHFKKGEKLLEPIWYLDSGCSRSMTGVKSNLYKYVEQLMRTPVLWAKIEESRLIGPEMVQETTDKMFEVGDQVLLKVSPWKGVVRFGKKGKLAPRYAGPFKIIERIGSVAYRLILPQELSSMHDTFHVLNLKKCLVYANLHVPLEEIKLDNTLCFVEKPVEIMDREVKRLKCSKIPIIKLFSIVTLMCCNDAYLVTPTRVSALVGCDKWQPPRSDTCIIFDHNDDQCPKKVKVVVPNQVSDDGFAEVTRMHRKGKQNSRPRDIDGVHA
ncbi:hypothetical protein Tco_1499841 [Tanacetum coccineum]